MGPYGLGTESFPNVHRRLIGSLSCFVEPISVIVYTPICPESPVHSRVTEDKGCEDWPIC